MIGIDFTAARQPLYASCTRCDHRWVVAYTPMELGTFARVLRRASCPNCGATRNALRLHDPTQADA